MSVVSEERLSSIFRNWGLSSSDIVNSNKLEDPKIGKHNAKSKYKIVPSILAASKPESGYVMMGNYDLSSIYNKDGENIASIVSSEEMEEQTTPVGSACASPTTRPLLPVTFNATMYTSPANTIKGSSSVRQALAVPSPTRPAVLRSGSRVHTPRTFREGLIEEGHENAAATTNAGTANIQATTAFMHNSNSNTSVIGTAASNVVLVAAAVISPSSGVAVSHCSPLPRRDYNAPDPGPSSSHPTPTARCLWNPSTPLRNSHSDLARNFTHEFSGSSTQGLTTHPIFGLREQRAMAATSMETLNTTAAMTRMMTINTFPLGSMTTSSGVSTGTAVGYGGGMFRERVAEGRGGGADLLFRYDTAWNTNSVDDSNNSNIGNSIINVYDVNSIGVSRSSISSTSVQSLHNNRQDLGLNQANIGVRNGIISSSNSDSRINSNSGCAHNAFSNQPHNHPGIGNSDAGEEDEMAMDDMYEDGNYHSSNHLRNNPDNSVSNQNRMGTNRNQSYDSLIHQIDIEKNNSFNAPPTLCDAFDNALAASAAAAISAQIAATSSSSAAAVSGTATAAEGHTRGIGGRLSDVNSDTSLSHDNDISNVFNHYSNSGQNSTIPSRPSSASMLTTIAGSLHSHRSKFNEDLPPPFPSPYLVHDAYASLSNGKEGHPSRSSNSGNGLLTRSTTACPASGVSSSYARANSALSSSSIFSPFHPQDIPASTATVMATEIGTHSKAEAEAEAKANGNNNHNALGFNSVPFRSVKMNEMSYFAAPEPLNNIIGMMNNTNYHNMARINSNYEGSYAETIGKEITAGRNKSFLSTDPNGYFAKGRRSGKIGRDDQEPKEFGVEIYGEDIYDCGEMSLDEGEERRESFASVFKRQKKQ